MSDEQETTEEREKKERRKREMKSVGWGCLGIFGLILEFIAELFLGIISCFG